MKSRRGVSLACTEKRSYFEKQVSSREAESRHGSSRDIGRQKAQDSRANIEHRPEAVTNEMSAYVKDNRQAKTECGEAGVSAVRQSLDLCIRNGEFCLSEVAGVTSGRKMSEANSNKKATARPQSCLCRLQLSAICVSAWLLLCVRSVVPQCGTSRIWRALYLPLGRMPALAGLGWYVDVAGDNPKRLVKRAERMSRPAREQARPGSAMTRQLSCPPAGSARYPRQCVHLAHVPAQEVARTGDCVGCPACPVARNVAEH